jgi:hypothetical protein
VYNFFRCDLKCDLILRQPTPKWMLRINELSARCKTCDLFLNCFFSIFKWKVEKYRGKCWYFKKSL